jgi:1-aminocyclopropane-1-carboxylate deaminase/D-cysteine desulfhydrase-like pyridoxal-dependent ACC family enzyme
MSLLKHIQIGTFFLCSLLSAHLFAELSRYEKDLIQTMASCVIVPEPVLASFDKLSPDEYVASTWGEPVFFEGAASNCLFAHYPALQNRLSYVSLGDVPTAVLCCTHLCTLFPRVTLFVKHDGLTGIQGVDGRRVFGGNKLRKLQYLLADALAHGHSAVLTFGCVGSNHALQTAVCAHALGLKAFCMLRPQPNSHVVRRNLLLQELYEAELYLSPDRIIHGLMTAAVVYNHKQRYGTFPYIIPVGGSCARGCIGYVEAAFELKEQIEGGLLPVPDRIYVTLGSAGTASGLLLGLKAAGIHTKLYLVLEAPEGVTGTALNKVKRLFGEANALLQSYDATFPTCSLSEDDYELITDCAGTAYGLFTEEAVDAMHLLHAHEEITLDGTYTGKCFAALVRDVQAGACDDQTVLFWNTFYGEACDHLTSQVDYHALPVSLHEYFERDVQPLDR